MSWKYQRFIRGGIYVSVYFTLGGIASLAPHPVPSQAETAVREISPLFVTESRELENEPRRQTPPCDPGGCPRPLINRNVPHLITPRQTQVAGDRLELRWYEPEDVEQYTLILRRRRDGEAWQTRVSEPGFTYQGELLQPGTRVVVTVDAHNGEAVGESQFVVMSQAQQEALDERLRAVEAANLGWLETILAKVELYDQVQAFANSIDLLSEAIATTPDEPQLYCRLAALYQQHYPELSRLNVYQPLQEAAEDLGVTCESGWDNGELTLTSNDQ